ncbi:MAG: DUF6580 family putative transport protein [Bacteroidia bacterium]|nr:hypothetical protein [Bacteroidia bacterium]MDW8134524.1 DUF6580 family putative transport protein [Bacteroidia bacterium]
MLAQLLAASFLTILGVAGRLLPHPPNFTPVEAVALFSGAWMRNPWLRFLIPITIMGITDVILGWHDLWPFTWGGVALGTWMGSRWLQPTKWLSVIGLSWLQATLFFLITNFGVWVMGWYGYSLQGLFACYLAAIPFYHYQLIGAFAYGSVFWILEYFIISRLAPQALSTLS